VIQIANVYGGCGLGARLLQRQAKEAGIRFLDAPLVRIQYVIEPFSQVDAIKQVAQTAIGVGDHNET